MVTKTKKFQTLEALSEELKKLAFNLWWTWNPAAQEIFKDLSPLTWERSNHNPIAVLKEVSQKELLARLKDPDIHQKAISALKDFHSYMSNKNTWTAKYHKGKFHGPISYFSAEFGLHESLPIYSGGLGVLTGDHTKSASDLGLPLIGISLFYRQGYFLQHIGSDGWQQETNPIMEPSTLPMTLVTDNEGKPIVGSVEIGHSIVRFTAWKVEIGRLCIYLLDTNLPENDHHFQRLTAQVYGGDLDTRIAQEIVLGIGGVRLLRLLDIHPSVYHMNEGHSAFLTLELLSEQLKKGKTKESSISYVKDHCIFTTHTPVPAGHDRFSTELIYDTLNKFWSHTGLSFDELMDLGRVHPHRTEDPFMMTVLALKMSRKSNGVSELHGHTSRDMWKELYGKENPNDVPIHYVTNGIHTPSWANQTAHLFWNKRLGADWTEKLMKPEYWMRLEIDHIASDAELWALRYSLRRNLVEYVRKQLHEQHLREGTDGHYDHVLSPDALTICFARRFATYKRAPLIFRNLEQTLSIFTNPDYPVQIIFAGKAHPRDNEGKRFLQQIIEMTHHHQLFGKVAFIENYDINVARYLISGADVWLNTPLRPLEASGTSGMKILIHGGLNFSIMDGWWREGYDGKNGWKIGNDSHSDPASQDEQDFNDMLRMLRDEIIPEFYTRDSHGIPTAWIKRIRHSMRTLIPRFNTDRMVEEYVTDYYLKTK